MTEGTAMAPWNGPNYTSTSAGVGNNVQKLCRCCSVRWRSQMDWMYQIRARFIHSTSARSANSLVITVAVSTSKISQRFAAVIYLNYNTGSQVNHNVNKLLSKAVLTARQQYIMQCHLFWPLCTLYSHLS